MKHLSSSPLNLIVHHIPLYSYIYVHTYIERESERETEREEAVRSTELKSRFKSRKTTTGWRWGVWHVPSIWRRMNIRSMQPCFGRNPACCQRTLLPRIGVRWHGVTESKTLVTESQTDPTMTSTVTAYSILDHVWSLTHSMTKIPSVEEQGGMSV